MLTGLLVIFRMELVYVLGVFPSVSEYFILQEILELQRKGVKIHICSIGHPEVIVKDLPSAHSLLPVTIYRSESGISCIFGHIRVSLVSPLNYVRSLIACFSGIFTDIVSVSKQLKYFNTAIFFVNKLQKEKYQHIHAHFASMPADVAMQMAKLTGKAFSVSAHAQDIYVPDNLLVKKINSALFVLTCTQSNQFYLTNISGRKDVIHIYHGIDLNLWPFTPERLPQKKNTLKILSIARLVEKKGLIYLLEALTILKATYTIDCMIVGEGGQRDVLEQFIRENSLEGMVHLSGALTQDKLQALYREFDFFVLPCLVTANGDRDGLPNVLLEAMAAGIPTITTGISAIPELLNDRVNGLIVEEKNALSIVDAIRLLYADSAFRKNIVIEARKTVEAFFSIEQSTNKLISVFQQALKMDDGTH